MSKQTPFIRCEHISRVFEKKLDFASRAARRLGANISEERVQAVDDVNLYVMPGEVVGLVGESGCGKSTLGRMICGILPQSEGAIHYKGRNVAEMSDKEKLDYAINVQMIFQDPFASLNPRKRVKQIIGEAPLYHGLTTKKELASYLDGVMEQCCDESVAALDVSIQAQILNLFMELREKHNLTCLFISHDLGVVEHISDRIAVMYLGRIVESSPVEALFEQPLHPYTQALLNEVPRLDKRDVQFSALKGEIPSPLNPPRGCHFHPRCPHAMDICKQEAPVRQEAEPGRFVRCHLHSGK